METPKIHFSKNYDMFQFYKFNRDICPQHVQLLENDPTFPEKFPTCAIVVDPSMNIIEGQHRFLAAKNKDIGIFYIIDPNGKPDDVRKRNKQARNWKGKDYIKYYSETGNENYKLMKLLLEKYCLTPSALNSVIVKLYEFNQKKYSYNYSNGTIDLSKYAKELIQLCGELFPALKNIISCRTTREGKEVLGKNYMLLFTDAYLNSFVHFYKKDYPKFLKILDKLLSSSHEPCPVNSYEQARAQLLLVYNAKNMPHKKCKN